MMVHRYLILALVSLTIGPWYAVKAGVLEDVKDYVEAFSAIAAPAGSVGEQLKLVSLRMSRLMQLGGPVSTFAALAMQKALEPESEEMQALKLLHSSMLDRFNGIDQRIEHLENKLVEHLALREYNQMITHPLDTILRVYYKVINPERNRTLYRRQFINFCTDRLSPHASLIWINRRVNIDCVLPTQEEAAVFVKANQFFELVDKNSSKFAYLTQSRYADLRWRIINAVSLAKNSSWLDSIEKKIHGSNIFALENAIVELRHSLKKLTFDGGIVPSADRMSISKWISVSSSCILKDVSDANENLRDALYQLVLMIELDALKLVAVGTVCANVSHHGDREGILDELADIRSLGISIASSMRVYSEKKLETAWPTLMIYYANKTLDNLQKQGIDSNTSNAIKFALDKRGPFNFFHNVLLSPKWEGPHWYYAECEPILCIDLQNMSSPFNLFIARYEHLQHQRAYRAYRYVYGNANRIREIMRDTCYAEELPLPDCLEMIKREFPALRSYATYGNAVLIHTRGLRKADATIPTAITSFTTSGSRQTTQLVELFHNPGILSLAHYFKLFLLL